MLFLSLNPFKFIHQFIFLSVFFLRFYPLSFFFFILLVNYFPFPFLCRFLHHSLFRRYYCLQLSLFFLHTCLTSSTTCLSSIKLISTTQHPMTNNHCSFSRPFSESLSGPLCRLFFCCLFCNSLNRKDYPLLTSGNHNFFVHWVGT